MALIDELPSAICTLLTRTAMALVPPLTRIGRTHQLFYFLAFFLKKFTNMSLEV